METCHTRPQLDESRCTYCGLCVDACPCDAVHLEEQKLTFDCTESCSQACLEALDDWCLCEDVCPTGAITCAFEIVIQVGQSKENK